MKYDTIIIGAGPAGLMCANVLKDENVLVLEKQNKAGKKLLITGGGRCNLTNLKTDREFLEAVEYNKRFLYSSIASFGPYDIYDFFDKEVPLYEMEENQIFPKSNKSNDILSLLLKDIQEKIKYDINVSEIIKLDDGFELVTNRNKYYCNQVVVCCGGKSFKATGSSGDHMKFANDLDIKTIELFPAESSILLKEENELAGTSFDNVVITLGKIKKDGHFVFTHKGISGNAAMKMSEFVYLQKAKEIKIDFVPAITKEEIIEMIEKQREKLLVTTLTTWFTKKFSEYLVKKANIDIQLKNKQLIHKQVNHIIELIKNHKYIVERVEDLEKAYVTGGGIDTKEINNKTMEVKKIAGLYFAGESLDIHGPIGGYNLTLAFSTGHKAGCSIQEKQKKGA